MVSDQGEYTRSYRQEHREALAEYGRRYRQKNRDAIAEYRSRPEYKAKQRERNRRYREAKKEELIQRRRESGRDRRYRQENRDVINTRRRSIEPEHRARWTHGPNAIEVLTQMWNEQDGCCYLCGGELVRQKAVVDHDHACCPKGKTCSACRRGYACQRCNKLIGAAGDDPDLLRRIADNLERAAEAAKERIAATPVQLEMGA